VPTLTVPGAVGEDYFIYRSFDGVNYGELTGVAIEITPDSQPSLSYFVPGRGTINAEIGIRQSHDLIGSPLPYEMVVNPVG